VGGYVSTKIICRTAKKSLLFGASVVECIHEEEILHQHRHPSLRDPQQGGLHVRRVEPTHLQGLDGEGFLRGQIP